ncbi:MAG: hypothetical protein AVO33_03315 [delta proteobacterium ML8_F1]|nr:MAG: hypothetical protein AVO33_03315 [delta proteobacterium ML8_F1]
MKKYALIIVFIWLMGIPAFAQDAFDGPVEVVSPVTGNYNDVVVGKDLYISVRIDEPVDYTVELVKMVEFEVDLEILDKMFLNIELTEEEKQQIIGANVVRIYNSLGDRLRELESSYDELSGSGGDFEEDLISLEKEIRNVSNQYEEIKASYEALSYQTVIEEEPLVYEGVLPFYERRLSGVPDGSYHLIFRDGDDSVIYKYSFNLKTIDTVASEVFESIPQHLLKLFE